MSVFKHLLVRLGSGAMVIHTKFEKKPYKRGDEVHGTIEITGGKVTQKALGILIFLMVEQEDGEIVSFGDYKVYGSFETNPSEKQTFPFVIELPKDGPFSSEDEHIFLMTNVVKLLALDQRDKQYIEIEE